ncbi:aspartate aminotransferase family protein [Kineococcus sp. LSe6-4]|uniref:Aspartate aminotransferase family protein n=1 Tax=Kineococcus halophytocola TaxID=3234027 RepID=A0ABV4H2M8_9ACTN
MRAQDVRLEPQLIERLRERSTELIRHADLWTGEVVAAPAERAALERLADRLANTYPYGDARYVGQILKPPHPVAWAAYATTMLLNPNNHALDGGPATAALEKEAVAQVAEMFGYPAHLGHLTSSGTLANLEALWIARELHPGKVVLSSEAAHYTHSRMCAIIGAPHEKVAQDAFGRLDVVALEDRLVRGDVGTVVATLGTTGMGALDPVHLIADLCEKYGVRLHVDGAYGGFHTLLAADPALVDPAPFRALPRADSIVVDPHKHGLQPYGCGCVVFRDPSVGQLYSHDSPYTYFTSDDLHLGEISIECSRAGASAAAFWTTLQALPLTRSGLGAGLAEQREATLRITASLRASTVLDVAVTPDLDIVCPFPRAATTSEVSRLSQAVFDAAAQEGWHLAELRVSSRWLARQHPDLTVDSEDTVILRCCVMKPEHAQVADAFVATLERAASSAV